MTDDPTLARRRQEGLTALRWLLSTLIFIHGAYRLSVWGMPDFGGWLDSQGIPFGVVVAWVITLMECLGTPILASGRFPRLQRPLALWYATILLGGLVMVHAPEGWFVVGAGRNGAEYAASLVAGFLITAWVSPPVRAGR
jgi:putative oxidoreductase